MADQTAKILKKEEIVIDNKAEIILSPISVIIPAYNEEEAIGAQVADISSVLRSHRITYEVIVIDDGSHDRTAEFALKTDARVIKHPENRGYGAALKTGITAAKYETIIMIDADRTYPAEQIPSLLDKLEAADMVIGARIGSEVHNPLFRRPAKWMLGWLANRIAGRRIPDLNSGMRAFRRDFIKQYFSILPDSFSFTTTITLAMFADNYRVVYHTIDYYERVGKSKINPWHFMDFMTLILRVAVLFKPLTIFIPLALLCGFFGVLKAAIDITLMFLRVSTFGWAPLLYQSILSPTAILLLLVGLQLLLIGMVADALLKRISKNNRPLKPSQGIYISELVSNQRVNAQNIISNIKK